MSEALKRIVERSMRGSVYLAIEQLLIHSASHSDWPVEIAEEFEVPVEEVRELVLKIATELGCRGMKSKGK